MKKKVLILTDSSRHIDVESLFPITRHLVSNSQIDSVYVADRADVENAPFYHSHSLNFTRFYARRVDDRYALETTGTFYPASMIPIDDFDAVWIRLDHPVTDDFLKYVQALMPAHFIINDPDGLIKTRSKAFLLELSGVLGDAMPPLTLCNTAQEVEDFKKHYESGVVLKQLESFGGRGVVRYRDSKETDLQNRDDVANYLAENGPCIAMKYLDPQIGQSDDRIVVANGVAICALRRTPGKAGWLCNLTSGGMAEDVTPRQDEIDIVELLDPVMRRHGIFLYGADLLLDEKGRRVLSEINTLNVGGITESEAFNGRSLSKFIADYMATIIAERDLQVTAADRRIIEAPGDVLPLFAKTTLETC